MKLIKLYAPVRWQCRNCGYIYGSIAPARCPACLEARVFFEPARDNY